ncbi:MAG TPA: hypothetical protein VF980_05825 [Thermoanaerobaculia bacterium]
MPVTACEAIDWLRRVGARLTPSDVAAVQFFMSEVEVDPAKRFEPPTN